MSELTTRDKLLEAAIELFSEKGFAATGVDEIAESIGIKGPNLYKYFKGKSALLEAIMSEADAAYNERMGLDCKAIQIPQNGAELKLMTLGQLEYTMNNPKFRKLRKLFTIEQYRDETFSNWATLHQITNMQKQYAHILHEMIIGGQMAECDTEILALEYISPITLMIQLCDRQPERYQEIMSIIEKHIDQFIATYLPR